MSEESNSEKIVPEAETAEATEEIHDAKPASKGNGVAVLLGLLALLVSVSTVAAGWYLYLQDIRPAVGANQRVDDVSVQFEHQLSEATSAWGQQSQQLAERLKTSLEQQQALRTQLSGLEDNLALLRSQANWGKREWQLAEVGYLIQMAEDRLHFMRDRGTALEALSTAVTRMDRIADPALAPLRQRLNTDRQLLIDFQADNPLSVLDRLEAEVSKLRAFPHEDSPPKTVSEVPGERAPISLMDKVKATLSQRFRVVHHDETLNALDHDTVERHQLELLQLRMEALRLALLQDNPRAFRWVTLEIEQWAKENLGSERAQPVLTALEALKTAQPFPKLPSLKRTLAMLRAILSKKDSES